MTCERCHAESHGFFYIEINGKLCEACLKDWILWKTKLAPEFMARKEWKDPTSYFEYMRRRLGKAEWVIEAAKNRGNGTGSEEEFHKSWKEYWAFTNEDCSL